jgi:hypothetical protein
MNMLLRFRAPFTAGKLNCPTDAPFHPPPPPLFWSVLRFTVPGVINSNSVKLRPFKGRSFIWSGDTTVPNSEVAVCKAGASAVTVTLLVVPPTFRRKSNVAVWPTWRVTGGCDTAVNPVADACML